MKRIIIIGCGYAGVVAAWRLSAHRNTVDVAVIDRSRNFNFLPLLPDSIGRKISPRHLVYPIDKLSLIYRFKFMNEEVESFDPGKRVVTTSRRDLDYDYLIIASGSETNFYGNGQIKRFAYKLDDAQDASKIAADLSAKELDSFVIGGGGYTGIEIATNLKVHLNRNFRKKKVVIVERAPSILGPLPQWMKDYVLANLGSLGIEIFTNTVIEKIEEGGLTVSGGRQFDNAMLIWAAGVKTSDFLQNLKYEKNPQGRIKVDAYLRLNDHCFAAGDASYFQHENSYLRMAVQFAIAQASCAASNILRDIAGQELRKFRPQDLGYIIPMANNKACGNVLGKDIKGKAAIALHYLMSLYRAYGFKNKWGIIKALLRTLK
ncbi:MAG: FAD-dependent oxidoreductase [Candidatus Omnitrophota bacterium]